MKLHRKQFTTLALAALATGFLGSATAQSAYPSKTVTMVVPTAAGGTTDLSARMLAQALGPVLGQTVVVDNKGGGNGNIAASIVKRAEADGYTLLMQYSGYHVISPHITKQKQWDQGDFQPVANIISAPQIIVVRADLPVKTLPELIAYAKANPGKLNYASSGNGSLQHVTGAMLEQQGGIKMVHVPYKGTGPALQDLLGDGWSVVEEGLPGRTAVFDDPITEGMNGLRVITPILMSHAPLDTVTIMLGTNDSKERFGCNSHLISLGIVRLVKKALHTECWRDNARPDVLVIVPPSITPEYDHLIFKDAMGTGCHERCAGIAAQLEPMLKDIANVRFLDANKLPGAGCSPLDGMHMTVQSHKVLAKALQKALTGDTL